MKGEAGDAYFEAWKNGQIRHDLLSAAIETLQSDSGTIIDVGANIGVTALRMAQLRPQCQVWALEPSPTTFAYLRDNAAAARNRNVHVVEAAVGSYDGSVGWSGSSADSSASHLANNAYADEIVPIITLDTFVVERGLQPNFVKVDVEGFEVDVINGARSTIADYAPVFFVEMNSFTLAAYGRRNPLELTDLLRQLFTHVYWLCGNGQLRGLHSDSDVLAFMHEQFLSGLPVHDLICIPAGHAYDEDALAAAVSGIANYSAAAIEIASLQEQLAVAAKRLDDMAASRTWRLAMKISNFISPFRRMLRR
ncbi:MAG: FkbM family methyltransferase [Caulobacteraceae bacterium]|nr:FkbM family methyltransferase [Caulobacter sp.]